MYSYIIEIIGKTKSFIAEISLSFTELQEKHPSGVIYTEGKHKQYEWKNLIIEQVMLHLFTKLFKNTINLRLT